MLAHIRTPLLLSDLWQSTSSDKIDPIGQLEQAFAERFEFPYGVLFPYGRSALFALIVALDLRDREVLCPAYTCEVVPHTVRASGNRVVYADSACDHFLPGAFEWNAKASSQSAMAIVTPLFGYPVDKGGDDSIRRTAAHAFILYDEAQSYGTADMRGVQMRDADGALFSLGLGKFITALTGGVLLLRDAALDRAVRAVRDRVRVSSIMHTIKLITKGIAASIAFREPAVSLLDRLSDWITLPSADSADWGVPEVVFTAYQGQIGLQQFRRIDRTIANRRVIGDFYEHRLKAEGFRTFSHVGCPTWPRFPWPVANREVTSRALRSNGIQAGKFLSAACADLPNARLWAASMLNLPIWLGLDLKHAEKVVQSLVRLRDRDPAAVAWPSPSARPLN